MVKEINIPRFKGMDNVSIPSGGLVPHIILNMDNHPDGKLVKRDGFVKVASLTNPHSLFSFNGELLVVAEVAGADKLLKINTTTYSSTILATLTEKGARVSYAPLADRVYISSKYWHGVYTNGSIRPFNTPPNPALFELNSVVDSEVIYKYNLINPPCMEGIQIFGGRLWGYLHKTIYYSEPFAYEWCRDTNFFTINEPITLIANAHAEKGMYVATATKTYYINSYNIHESVLKEVGDGAIPYTLQYCSIATNTINGDSIPVWMSPTGIMAGTKEDVVNLFESKIKYTAPEGIGAALFRMTKGFPQYVVSTDLPSGQYNETVGFGDNATCEVFRNGKLI